MKHLMMICMVDTQGWYSVYESAACDRIGSDRILQGRIRSDTHDDDMVGTQGWYSVYDSDAGTLELVYNATARLAMSRARSLPCLI